MYSRSNQNVGFSTNISIDPSSNSQSSQQITNNIIVKTATGEEPVVVERSIDLNEPSETNSVIINNVENDKNVEKESVEKILLDVYKSILLSQNKQLLANILSKKHIMIYKEDLEKVITAKINKKCAVVLKEVDGCGCTAKIDPFAVIDSIVIYEDNKRVDFKVAYNSDYVELSEKFALSLKICLV
jgi:hypothetical protein